ncbi:DUF1178 family protein [Cognatishimia sp. SS12]|uniref:DUF1178 family protein n=1 Tax=Cognatishimia sp. SS12 TaxID=2979465 RepID=UPI00232D5630|nr:DUF1178 family protein [Cognatishimia sp. SS12]MDC0736918.1 DUF1178 family protein [Cognatishimia sp. SS12]
MIQFSLKCAQGHQFSSWFQSGAAFDKLKSAGMVTCAVCGATEVEKAIMAPRVRAARSAVSGLGETEQSPAPQPVEKAADKALPLSTPQSEVEKRIAEVRKAVEANSDYVGDNFASEARAIHSGDSPERAIYGEAKPDDARALIEDGIPVLPLPFRPGRKSN